MCLLMSTLDKGDLSKSDKVVSEPCGSCERQDETTKKGACLLEIRRTGMVQWGVFRRVASVGQHGENSPQLLSTVVKEEQKDDEEAVTVDSHLLPEIQKRKRKCLTTNQLRDARPAKCPKLGQAGVSCKHKQMKQVNSIPCKKKNSMPYRKENLVARWSMERYKQAEKSMLEVMKAEGAVFDNPISRPLLRMAARKRIGDTGLLDHLLKHIDGKLAPGGTERFRRCYNTEGIMEYWLESADVVKIKRETGMPDPWVPPSCWKPNGVTSQDSVCAGDVMLLKEDMVKMKRDMEELMSKNQEQDRANPIEEMHKELLKWRGMMDQRVMEISSSLSDLQGMYRELVAWKSRTEQHLKEISNTLSSMQASKQCTTFSPASERWEDWLESTNLDSIQGEDLAPWLETTDLVNVGRDTSAQEPHATSQPWLKPCGNHSLDPVCSRELELLKEEMAKMKRDVQELVPKRMEEDHANVTPDSYATVNSKLDLDNSILLFQEMFKELVKWKAKMEQQILEISNSVSTLQATKQYTA